MRRAWGPLGVESMYTIGGLVAAGWRVAVSVGPTGAGACKVENVCWGR